MLTQVSRNFVRGGRQFSVHSPMIDVETAKHATAWILRAREIGHRLARLNSIETLSLRLA